MVERVLGAILAIFENATAPTQAYVTRWALSVFQAFALALSRSPHACICVSFV